MHTSSPENPLEAVRAQLVAIGELAARLDTAVYVRPVSALHGSSIGQHLRHCLDHVTALLAGLDAGAVDYDARARASDLETDPRVAAACARDLAAGLCRRAADLTLSTELTVCSACDTAGELTPQHSSFGRELQFLVSHGVHHLAMVAAMCRLQGVAVDGALGVAPSTLRHRVDVSRSG